MTKIFKASHAAHEATVHAFENYGHIFFFAQIFYDHGESTYGVVAISLACVYSVAAIVNRKGV